MCVVSDVCLGFFPGQRSDAGFSLSLWTGKALGGLGVEVRRTKGFWIEKLRCFGQYVLTILNIFGVPLKKAQNLHCLGHRKTSFYVFLGHGIFKCS